MFHKILFCLSLAIWYRGDYGVVGRGLSRAHIIFIFHYAMTPVHFFRSLTASSPPLLGVGKDIKRGMGEAGF